jgi:hypothetical protein
MPIGLLMGLCAGLVIASTIMVQTTHPPHISERDKFVLKHKARGLYVFWATLGGLIGQIIEIWVR